MSTKGELFVTETLRDYLEKEKSEFEFSSLRCNEMKDCASDLMFPDRIYVLAFDEHDYLIATVFVFLGFKIESSSTPQETKQVAAYIKKIEIIGFDNPMKLTDEGQLICPCCEKPMKTISQTQNDIIRWHWNKKGKEYIKAKADGDSEQCMCDHCGKHIGFDVGEFLGY